MSLIVILSKQQGQETKRNHTVRSHSGWCPDTLPVPTERQNDRPDWPILDINQLTSCSYQPTLRKIERDIGLVAIRIVE